MWNYLREDPPSIRQSEEDIVLRVWFLRGTSFGKCHGVCFFFKYIYIYIYIYIWLCLFFRGADFSKGGKFEFCEPYPRVIPRTIPRIIPANHTPKNHDYECFFWDRLGLHGLTSFNGRDKPIDKCWPDPMIPGCLHIPSRHEWWGWLAG